MPGGFNPAAFRYGASRHHIQEVVLDALNEADGTGLTKEQESYNYAENFAVARAIADFWSANRRLSYQWDAQRMTDFLGRWETILGLVPELSDTVTARRALVLAKQQLVGQPATLQVVHDLMVAIIPSIFLAVIHTDSTDATASVPGGVTIAGGVTLADGPWSSSIANVAIKVIQPIGMTDSEFYTLTGKIQTFLDQLLPAWVDFNWFVESGTGTGFWLDESRNLDNQAFS